jgi:hypothetical protein
VFFIYIYSCGLCWSCSVLAYISIAIFKGNEAEKGCGSIYWCRSGSKGGGVKRSAVQ